MRSMKASLLGVLSGGLLCSAVLLCESGLMAQGANIAPRITAQADEASLTTLHGNVPLLARAEFDQGEADASMQLSHVRLVLSRSSEQQAELDQYLAQLQDKSSPNYHKWLTPQQFGQLYGPADSDLAALVAWLQSQGLTLETVSVGRTNISFSGSVSQVEAAFHTSIHSFQSGDAQFYSNTTDPRIPSALAPVVMGVAHLNTIRPRPQSVRGSTGRFNPEKKRLEPLDAVLASGARPELTSGSGTASVPYFLFMVPGDAATIYDTPNSYNANFSGTSYTGAGVHIGIGCDAAIDPTIVMTGYRSTFLGNSTGLIVNYCTTSTSCSTTNLGSGFNTGDAGEAYIDTEISGGMAPGAVIDYYYAQDLDTAIEAAIDANVADIFSLSFGECERDLATSDNAAINGWWEQAASQGIAVTVSAGDNGSAGCDNTSDSKGNNVPEAVGGLQVSGLASTPYNIAVGGTDFYALDSSTYSTYASTSQGSSSTYYRTALKYIPESAWNDSTSGDTTFNVDIPYTGSNANIMAGSGGVSNCSTNSTTSSTVGSCTSGYNKPSWQTGKGVPSDGARDLPDVSFMAGNGNDPATWAICDDGTTTYSGATVTMNCQTQSDGYWFVDGYGGTSAAAPAFAGILAMVQQRTGGRLGQAARELYALYNGSHSGAIFHDVTVGNNSVPCTSSTPNCNADALGYYFESGYNTNTGYDLATGLGSVDASQLVNYWSSATGSATAAVSVNPSPDPVTTSESLTVTISVFGSSGTPTGTVTLISGSYNSGAQSLASSGSCTAASCAITVPAGSLATGTDTLAVTYSGDATYATKTNNSITVTVTGSSSSSTFALAATNIASLTPGATSGNTSTVTATTTNGYTGTVTLTCALTTSPSGASYLPTCSGPVPSAALTMGGAGSVFTVNTTAASAALLDKKLPGKGRSLFGAGGGAVLALMLFLGVPARRRSWHSMLSVLLLLAALGCMSACNSSISVSGSRTAGTAAGAYTFTVTGTGNDANATKETTTFTVTVS